MRSLILLWLFITKLFNVFLKLIVLLLGLNTGQLHTVIATKLGSFVPISLEDDAWVQMRS